MSASDSITKGLEEALAFAEEQEAPRWFITSQRGRDPSSD